MNILGYEITQAETNALSMLVGALLATTVVAILLRSRRKDDVEKEPSFLTLPEAKLSDVLLRKLFVHNRMMADETAQSIVDALKVENVSLVFDSAALARENRWRKLEGCDAATPADNVRWP